MIAQQQTGPEPTQQLGVFAKYWESGKVKTRLAAALGAAKAARIYEGFVAATIARLSAIDAGRVLAYAPANQQAYAAFQTVGSGGWSLVPQTSGDLGQRMAAFFDQQFGDGAERVVVLGTDSPNVPLVEVQEAFEHLKTTDVVLGPTEDGGYYLVGAARKTPPVFEAIPWSTAEVFTATIACLDSSGFSYATLDPWYDVDEIFDLHRLIEDLRDECQAEPALEVLLKHVLEVIEA